MGPGPNRTDANIAEAVRRALERDLLVAARQIRSAVSCGTVTLDGTVPYARQRYDAEQAVEQLAGVTRVINRIEVEATAPVDLKGAHRAIESALERHAGREARRIELHAVGSGVVSASGVVGSWQEKQAVLGAVRGAHGVRDVQDDLRIQS